MILGAILVSLCELTAHPEKYDGQVVRVAGVYSTGFEASRFEDRKCKDARVWVEFSAAVETDTPPKVLRRWNRALQPPPKEPCGSVVYVPSYAVNVTFLARFEMPETEVILGRTFKRRFGHLNGYDYQLTVLAIDRVGRGGVIGGNMVQLEPNMMTIDCETMQHLPIR